MSIKIKYSICILAALLLTGCTKGQELDRTTGSDFTYTTDVSHQEPIEETVLINGSGESLKERIKEPDGYVRAEAGTNSFLEFMQNFKLKEDGSPVLLYNGEEKTNQSAHAAVFDMSVGEQDLQQCADSIIRVYAEYYWSVEAFDQIAFHLTNGFNMEYSKWRQGNRLNVNGNDISWIKKSGYDDSYESFLDYLKQVFIYAGTLSLENEGNPVQVNEIEPGDMFIKGGSPGHCVLVVDKAEDESGNKCYLLAQGYMPAQEFHVLKNPLHEDDPWYYDVELINSFRTPEYSFSSDNLRRWKEGFQ